MASVIPQVLTSATADGRDRIQGSTRFSKDLQHYLYKSQSTIEGNSRCWTFSAWVRRNIHQDASWSAIYGAGSSSTIRDVIRFTNEDCLEFQLIRGGTTFTVTSEARFTDVTGWYHVVAIWDSGNPTQADRQRIYMNGQRLTASASNVTQDFQSPTCDGLNTWVGARTSDGSNPSLYFDGYMSEVYLVDGAAIEPSAFGFEDRVTKNWCPKKYNIPGINDGTVWSDYLSANVGTISDPTYSFNGNQSNFNQLANEGIITFTPPTPIRYRKSVKVWLRTAHHKARVNGGEWVFNTSASVEGKYLELPGSGEVRTIDVQYTNSSSTAINMIAIDDEVLIDSYYGHLGKHGFYFPLDGSDALGADQGGDNKIYRHVAGDDNFGATAPVDITAKAHGCNPILKTGTGRNPVAGEVNLDDGPNTIPIVRDSGAVHFKGVAGSYTDDNIRLEDDGGDLAELGNGDFTIECFVYIEDFNGERHYPIIQKGNSDNNNQYDWRLYFGDNENENLYFDFSDTGDGVSVNCGNGSLDCGVWHHIVVTRSGTASNNVKVYIDGKLAGQDSAGSDTVQNTYSEIQIGRSNLGSAGDTYFQGWISNVRIVEGTALYTGTSTTVRNFPEPEKKLTAVSGTRILACQDPDSPTIDNSGITFTPTLANVNSAVASTDNPFGNATTGSVSFTSASSQKIYVPDHQKYYIGKNDATVEFWIKTSTPTQQQYFSGQYGSSDRNLNAAVDSNGNVKVYYDDSDTGKGFAYTDLTLTANTWHHYALVIESGYIYAYLDGKKSRLRTEVVDYIKASPNEYAIGQIGSLTSTYTNGLISNFRFVNGKAVYTESFTPPTEDLTAITGTVLLACQSRTDPVASGAVPRTWGMWGTPYAAPNEVAGSCVLAVPFNGGANKDYSYKINHTSKEKTFTQTGSNLSNDAGIGPLYNQTKNFGAYNAGNWVKTNQSTDFYPNRGCWTIEHWSRRTDSSYTDNWQPHFDLSVTGDTYNSVEWIALLSNSDGTICFYYGTQANGHTSVVVNPDAPLNKWVHIAISYDGRKLRFFMNGLLRTTTDFEGTKYNWGGNRAMCIGHQHCCSNTREYSGNMADFRFYNGCCKYKKEFVVASVAPQSSNVLTESPSPVPTAYDLLKPKSGSVHFSRSQSSRLEFRRSYPAAVGTGDCTIECWVWLDTNDTSFPVIYDSRLSSSDGNGFFFGVNSTGRLYLWEPNDTRISYDVLEKQQWYHVALVRKSSVFTLYVNGESAGDWSSSDNYTNAVRHIGWTENSESQNWYWDGYISNYRFCTAAVYDGNFKVPTEPLTRTSQGATNCQILCCNDTNYYQKDDALLNPGAGLTITAAGSATHSTDNPFGTSTDGSVVLDANTTNDALQIANSNHIDLKDDDFTVESWLYLTTIDSTLDTWWCGSDYASSGTTNSINVYLINNGFRIFTRSGGSFQNIFDHSSSNGNGESPLSLNTWHHVAMTRSNNVFRIWVDGKQFGPDFTSTVSFDTGQNLLIGGNNYSGAFPEYEMGAKVSNFRVVTGTAIYNSNFEVPTSKLEHIPGTSVLCCQSRTSATATANLNGTVIIPNNWAQVSSHNPFEASAKGHQGNADCYATWNENWKSDDSDLRYGNLYINSSNRWGNVFATLGMYPKSQGGAGKYYWETTMYQDSAYVYNGLGDNTNFERNGNGSTWPGQSDHSWSVFHSDAGNGGSITHDGTYETTIADMNCGQWDTMMVAYNADTGQVWFGKNGTWYLGGNPTLGTRHSRLCTNTGSFDPLNTLYPMSDCYSNTSYTTFGQLPFKYTPPEGFGPVSLSRTSTAKVGDPQNAFAIRRWTGDGGTGNRVIADDLKFKPDLVWIKSWAGNDSRWWSNCDSVRGKASTAYWRNFLANTNAQLNDGYDVTDISESSTGVGSVSVNKAGDFCNTSGAEYAMYAFKAGGGTDNQNEHWRDGHKFANAAAAGMTTGTITPHSSSVGTKTGLSIVNYPGNSTDNATLSHGLDQPPNFYMCKELAGVTQGTAGSHWRVGHTYADYHGTGLTVENESGLYLSLDNAATANSHGAWFTSTLTKEMKHRTGSGNNNQHFHTNMTGFDYIMYMWHDVPGLQKFGSYRASGSNGSTNQGIDFGFEPAFVIVKSITSTAKWVVWDCTRRKDNVNWHTLSFGSLAANDEDASGGTTNEFYSGGVTFRGGTDRGVTSDYYIYAAWAQKPKFAYNNSSTAYVPGNTDNKTTNSFILPN